MIKREDMFVYEPDTFYYLTSWIDEFCDITIEKLVDYPGNSATDSKENTNRAIAKFYLSLGIVTGSLLNKEIREYLRSKEVSEEDMDKAAGALMRLGESAYR